MPSDISPISLPVRQFLKSIIQESNALFIYNLIQQRQVDMLI